MRTLSFLLLICVFPVMALSQVAQDQSIIDDYAHPAFIQRLSVAPGKIIIDKEHDIYLVAFHKELFHQRPTQGFTVLRQLSPTHAIVRIIHTTIDDRLFNYLIPANNAWKLSPALLQASKRKDARLRLLIAVTDAAQFKKLYHQHIQVIQEYQSGVFVIQTENAAAFEILKASPLLLFADLADRTPKEELLISGFDLGTNRVNVVHERFPLLTGEGLMLSLKENRFDTTDIDLKGRVVNSNIASATSSGHATIMATMAAGAGNSFYEGKGVAWKAALQSANFASLVPETDAFYLAQRISVQNHSYGTGIENFYGADAAAYDASVINNPALLHVFSAGNSGLAASNGPYAGITGFANITGSFKMAKNILVVGAIDSTGNIEAPSSKGPSYDGRVKPDLVAFGQEGSSGSAALVSGIALVMQHAYRLQHHDSLPPAALVKAALINTADDVGPKGLDYSSGYGSANAYEAVKSIQQSQFFTNTIQQGNTQSFQLNVPAGISALKLTLVWTDQPAQANAVKALVNDLDVELVHTASAQTSLPWILNRAANRDSLQLIAIRGRDTLNNTEQITLDAPAAGAYVINIRGSRVSGTQLYFVTYKLDTADKFEWLFPLTNDPMIASATQLLRWNATFASGATGLLQYSINEGNTWQTISTNVDLSKKYITWAAPDVFSTAILRMTISGSDYISDTFVLSKRLSTQVGFNCPDSFLFYWNRPNGVNSFRVYKLGPKFLEPAGTTSDSFYMNASATVSSKHFTVAPIVKNREGIKAYTFNYTTQGVDCYFKIFLMHLIADKAQLQLELASLYQVSRLLVQKLSGSTFTTIQTINDPTALQYSFNDDVLHRGTNIYRIALQLRDGRIIYSSLETVYYMGDADYVIYPNPASAISGFRIIQKEANEVRIVMHDITGRKVKDEMHFGPINSLSTVNLQKGLYFVTVWRNAKRVFEGKVVLK